MNRKQMAKSPWPERDEELKEYCKRRMTYSEIAAAMHCTKDQIIGRARRMNFRAPGRLVLPRATWTETLNAQLRIGWLAGKTRQEIRQQIGVSLKAISHQARRLGLPSRTVEGTTLRTYTRITRDAQNKPVREVKIITPRKQAERLPVVLAQQPQRYVRLGNCSYLLGEKPRWRYCDAPTNGSSYCVEHYARCIVKRDKAA